MHAHKKNHSTFKCNICEKTFKCQEVMEKHAKIAHEKMKIYCHFFNNKKICPYDNECIFLHEDSDVCRYDMLCERNYCMYKNGNVIVEETKKDDKPSDSVILEETENLNNETINKTQALDENRQSCLSGCPCYSIIHYIGFVICYFTVTKYTHIFIQSMTNLPELSCFVFY